MLNGRSGPIIVRRAFARERCRVEAMARHVYDFDPPDRFVADAVGQPGQRVFFLQARRGPTLVTVALEKVQVAVLAERMGSLLDELRERGLSIPEEVPARARDRRPLEEPLVEDFRAGSLTLAWDGRAEEFIVEARSPVETDDDEDDAADEVEVADDDPSGPDLLRVRLTPTAAAGFVSRALGVVAAGRPPCPLCGQPLDPQGHFCPRRNGNYQH
jgi:uncharacterized repeat protein (TIGR03847 family)